MYYRISDRIALRGWKQVECAYYERYMPYAQGLTRGEFMRLLLCDGEEDLEPDAILDSLVQRGLAVPCEKGEHPSEWSVYKRYENRYFPKMNLMITGKCNYNCLHCFNAADNAPLMSEWTFEELCGLFDQARDCGIHAITVTGGEPMAHPRFMDILREIHRRDMFVEELNTNGYYLTQEVLDGMKEIGCNPLMKISFDGIGWHDWMRNRKGAEQHTLEAMKRCVENGFRVKAQTQVHRKNLASMMPTARLLDSMGVEKMRIIRTSEAPRWAENAGDACLGMEEYYETMLDFSREYIRSGMKMTVDIWQFLTLFPEDKAFRIVPVSCGEGEYRNTIPGCTGNRGMVAVTSSGDVVPCLQLSGLMEQRNIHLGNLHRDRLRDLLTAGPYLENVCATAGGIRKNNPKCGKCGYFEYCTGGCRALGMLYSGEKAGFCGEDTTKCLFFENGWYGKTVNALTGWENLTEIFMEY